MRSKVAILLAEVVVVFVGVFAAFTLEQRRADRIEDARKQQFLSALHADFTNGKSSLDQGVPLVSAVIDSFINAHDRGERPEIGHFGLRVTGVNARAWEAMLQSGGVDVLPVDFVLMVEDFYDTVEKIDQTSAEARQMSAHLVLPNLDRGSDFFYDPATDRLKAPYQWYIAAMRGFMQDIREIRQKSEAVLDRLETLIEEVPEER